MKNSMLLEQTSSKDLLENIGLLIEEKFKVFESLITVKEKEDKLLTIDETASFLKISRGSVYNYQKMGFLKPVRIGNSTRFLLSDLISISNNTEEKSYV